MQKLCLIFALTLICPAPSRGQAAINSLKNAATRNIIEQIILFPQEKLYLQTDKPAYLSGETVWLRAYRVDAVLHKPVTGQYVYVDLINPLDSVVNRIKIRESQGAFSGHIDLNENLPEGDYTLCAYTETMQNRSKEFFFRKPVTILSPLSATLNTEVKFLSDKAGNITAEVSFENIISHRKVRPDGLRVRVNNQMAREVRTGSDTVAYFSFRLPQESRERVLSVETKKGGKLISVPYQNEDYEVSFYPEGGYLLEGVSCAVAFKALNSHGQPEKVTGHIVDNEGHVYAKVETSHDGMGLFLLTSRDENKYYAVCTNEKGSEKRFELPAAHKGAYSLSTGIAGDKLYISVNQSADIQEQKPLFLLLHTRGIVHYASPWDPDYNIISFNTEKFPSGVMQIILLDENMNPLSERLVFCLNNDQAQVAFNTDHRSYEARQAVNASVKMTDNGGTPLEGSFSVSVTDDNDIKPDSTSTILTDLLLTSELKGYINNPSYYFQGNGQEVKDALDLLMMTNGWRRYNIPDILRGNYETPKYPVKKGMEITGRVRSLILERPVIKGGVAIFSWDAGYFDEKETDAGGRFVFDGIEFPDSTMFVVQALNKKGSDGVELLIDADTFPVVPALPLMATGKIENRTEERQLSSYIAKADTRYTIENGMRTIYIDEVVIKGKAPEKKDYRFSYYMPGISPNIMTAEQIEAYQPMYLSDILKYIPHVELVTDEFGLRKVILGRMSYRLPGGAAYNYAALIIDDMIIHDYDIDNIIDPSNIERIGVLKGSQATLLGGDGAGGAIVITTKTGYQPQENTPRYNIRKAIPLGYQKPAEFYSPRYDTPKQRDNGQADLRTTLYWNPNVMVTSAGEAMFDFFTADAATTYSVVIEGVASDGAIIESRSKISRK